MDGVIYSGMFSQGVLSGFGKVIYKNSTSYEGEWKDNYAHGKGKYVTVDGIVYSGMFIEGKINYSDIITYLNKILKIQLFRENIKEKHISIEDIFQIVNIVKSKIKKLVY